MMNRNQEAVNRSREAVSCHQEAEPVFRLRMYGKSELAQLYFPHSSPSVACHALSRWIARCPEIREGLARLGHRKHGKYYTRREVEVIVAGLGEP